MPFSARIGFYQDQVAVGPAPAGYPSWPTMPTYSEWTDEANRMSYAGTVTYDMVGTVGTATNGNQFSLSIPGGNVFLAPRGNPAYEWDYQAETFSTITLTGYTAGATPSHLGAVISPYNGNVYIPPFGSAQTIIEYDPSTGVSQAISNGNLHTGGYYSSCPLADGRVIFKPRSSAATYHQIWDPANNTVTNTTISAGGSGFLHPPMVQHPKDGMVYMPPYRTAAYKKWDPTTDTYSTITLAAGSSSLPASDAYQDAVIGADSKIYATPWNAGDIGIFDIDTAFWERYDPDSAISTTERVGKGRLADDGRIYMFPYNEDDIVVIPTATSDSDYGFSGNTCTSNVFVTNISATIGSARMWDGAVDGAGNIICAAIVTNGGTVLRVNPDSGNAIVHDFHISPYVNQG